MHFTKNQNNVQAFVKLHIRPIILFCTPYFRHEVFTRFCFLIKITAEKVSPQAQWNKNDYSTAIFSLVILLR